MKEPVHLLFPVERIRKSRRMTDSDLMNQFLLKEENVRPATCRPYIFLLRRQSVMRVLP